MRRGSQQEVVLHSSSSSEEEVEGDPALPGSFPHCLFQNPHNILPKVYFHIVSFKIPTMSSQRIIFTLLSPSKSPQYPPKSKSEHETACVQSMFPAFKGFRLKPCVLRHSQKGTIEDGGTVRGNIILSIIYYLTLYYDIIFMIQFILLNGRLFQGAFSGARGSFQGQKVQGGQQVTST